MAAKNPSLAKKLIADIKKLISEVMGKIRAYFKDNPKIAKTEYGQAVLDAMSKYENRIQELWDKAVAEGIKAANAGVENANIQFSTRENLLFENSGKNESGDILKVTYDNIDKIPNKLTFSINEDFTFQSKNKSDDIFNYFKNIGGKAVNPDIGVVELNKAGSKSTLFHGFGKEKLASVYGIKDVIEKGVIISHVSNYNDKGYDRYIICGKGSLFGNNETYISVVVKSYPMNKNLNNKFYLHEVLLLEAKKETDSHILTGSQLSDKPVSESVSTNIIPVSSEKSNSSSQQNSDRFNDTDYLSAVDRGDIETAQRMVDEAAKAAGYNIKAYHQTAKNFTVFNTDNPKAGLNDSETPNGIFFKTNDHDIGLDGKKQMSVYLNVGKVLDFNNRSVANMWYQRHIEGYATLDKEMKAKVKEIESEMNSIETQMFSESITDDDYDKLDEQWNQLLEQMKEVENKYRSQLRELLNDYFLKSESGYNSIHLGYDGHRYVNGKREDVETYILFDRNKVKSADPVTYDDNGNVIPLSERFNTEEKDIRYSDRFNESDSTSDRTVLAEFMKQIAKTDEETAIAEEYGSYVNELDKLADELISVRGQIKDILFTKGADRSQLTSLYEKKASLERKINKWDKKLINQFETAAPLRDLFDRTRKEAVALNLYLPKMSFRPSEARE